MLTRIVDQVTVTTGERVALCKPRRAWSVLLIPTALVVLGYLVWSASLLMRPLPLRPSSYAVYLRTEQANLQQQLRQNELAILALQVRQRKIELDLLQAQYTRDRKAPALPPVTTHMIGAVEK